MFFEKLSRLSPFGGTGRGLHRGFTGHECLEDFKLYNMNGRLYDPVVGGFLSPDPYVQDPGFTQNLNRYSYCLNNPLKFTDPSGEFWRLYLARILAQAIPTQQNNYGFSHPQIDAQKMAKNDAAEQSTYRAIAEARAKCPDCLNPSTVGKNIPLLGGRSTYAGGENPLTYNKDYTYEYEPTMLTDYPAIGHDRRYDNLRTEGIKGLISDTRAIGADWRFVSE